MQIFPSGAMNYNNPLGLKSKVGVSGSGTVSTPVGSSGTTIGANPISQTVGVSQPLGTSGFSINAGATGLGQDKNPIPGIGVGYNHNIGGGFSVGANAGVGYGNEGKPNLIDNIVPSAGVNAHYQNGDVGLGVGYGTSGLTPTLTFGRGTGANLGGSAGSMAGTFIGGPPGSLIGSAVGSTLGSLIDNFTGSRYAKNKIGREGVTNALQNQGFLDANGNATLSSGASWKFDPSGATKGPNGQFAWEFGDKAPGGNDAIVGAASALATTLMNGGNYHGNQQALTGYLVNLATSKGDPFANLQEIAKKEGLDWQTMRNRIQAMDGVDQHAKDVNHNGTDQLWQTGAYANGANPTAPQQTQTMQPKASLSSLVPQQIQQAPQSAPARTQPASIGQPFTLPSAQQPQALPQTISPWRK